MRILLMGLVIFTSSTISAEHYSQEKHGNASLMAFTIQTPNERFAIVFERLFENSIREYLSPPESQPPMANAKCQADFFADKTQVELESAFNEISADSIETEIGKGTAFHGR